MIQELTQFWNSAFQNFSPKAHNLKHEYEDRWVRFHALPKSKRYPENEGEYLEIFRRYNIVLQELCGLECSLFIVLPEYSEKASHSQFTPELRALFSGSEFWRTLKSLDDDSSYCHLYASEVKFTANELNSLFRMIANNEVCDVMMICPNKGVVFHPYDGGIDIVLASTEERDHLKNRHSEWLPSHPSGL